MNLVPPYSLAKPSKLVVAAFSGVIFIAALQAETIEQRIAGTTQIGWNDPTLWGNGTDAVVNTNDYQTKSGFPISFPADGVVNGTTWSYTGMVRTSGNGSGAQTTSTTFSGNNLILSSETRLLGKNYNSTTATANIVLNGGYINYAVDSGANNSNGTLAGFISFGAANLGAILMLANTNYTLNVASTISGDATKTLQLSMMGGTGRTNMMNITGDMSAFFGSIYVGVAASGTSSTSFFSIQTDAINASLQLDAESNDNFRYDLGSSNHTFAAVTLNPNGTVVTLNAGQSYTATQLNELIGGGSKFFGDGTITVVPEPRTIVLSAIGLLGMIMMVRSRGQDRQKA